MMTIISDKITAKDLSDVVLLNSNNNLKKGSTFSNQELEYQENRRKRKARKLDFEIRWLT